MTLLETVRAFQPGCEQEEADRRLMLQYMELFPQLLTPMSERACDDGATRKTLWKLHDGALVESVLMGYPDRVTACVSSQAGCGMACPFCATGQAGLTRNLSTAEIVGQVFLANRELGWTVGENRVITNIVLMGMGEPLANFRNVIPAIRLGRVSATSHFRPQGG